MPERKRKKPNKQKIKWGGGGGDIERRRCHRSLFLNGSIADGSRRNICMWKRKGIEEGLVWFFENHFQRLLAMGLKYHLMGFGENKGKIDSTRCIFPEYELMVMCISGYI